ncbi:hypothetical protein BW731_05755 [Vagococcus martis]|uniref:Uncharacterized protein n=1 Tax=Vagococcus martis TaxID=1768210 RepID=A0A1V4DGP4_9ENTE|nr:hypothetical protein [Vagococcus martis]OPF87719.1 hypothetical protein BW731_05755 [Vagococcus martis]
MTSVSIIIGIIAILLSSFSIYLTNQINKKITEKQVKQDKDISKLSAKQESFIFMTQKQYEKEYNLFWNLFELLQKTIDKTKSVKGSLQLLQENTETSLEETYIKLIQEGIVKSSDYLNELDSKLNQYEPFIQEGLFRDFKQLIKELREFQQRRYNYFYYEDVTQDSINSFIRDIESTLDSIDEKRVKIVGFLRTYFENIRTS